MEIKLALGYYHTCVLLLGHAKCFGSNNYGDLGLLAEDAEYTYVDANGVPNEVPLYYGSVPNSMGNNLPFVGISVANPQIEVVITDITAGRDHTCTVIAITPFQDGLKCWGFNLYGQLGLGNNINVGEVGGLVDVSTLPYTDLGDFSPLSIITFSSLKAGYAHTCIIITEDSNPPILKCFGWNAYGQLGYGDLNNRGDALGEMGDALPAVDLGSGRIPLVVAAGQLHTCALLTSGMLKCWGSNGFGQLGLGDTNSRGGAPNQMGDNLIAVDLGTGLLGVSVATGTSHTCAILSDQGLKCWGLNEGQLGLGDHVDRGGNPTDMGDNLPEVNLGTDLVSQMVVCGEVHTCVLLNDTSLKCFGGNGFGQLGLGNGSPLSIGVQSNQMGDNLPRVSLGTDGDIGVFAVFTGCGSHNCALLVDNETIKCFGNNYMGELGLGDTRSRGMYSSDMGYNLSAVNIGYIPTFAPTPPTAPPTLVPTFYVAISVSDAKNYVCSRHQTMEECESDNIPGNVNFANSLNLLTCPLISNVCIWDTSEDIGVCLCGDISQRSNEIIEDNFLMPGTQAWIWGTGMCFMFLSLLKVWTMSRRLENAQRPRLGSYPPRSPIFGALDLNNLNVISPNAMRQLELTTLSAASLDESGNIHGEPASTLVRTQSATEATVSNKRTHSRSRIASRSDNL